MTGDEALRTHPTLVARGTYVDVRSACEVEHGTSPPRMQTRRFTTTFEELDVTLSSRVMVPSSVAMPSPMSSIVFCPIAIEESTPVVVLMLTVTLPSNAVTERV